mmetsp:Transcript_38773/g.44368  ORF Transcript_38773/g.44368 Transcript_38773/m.44368 type:complete len:80 (+) Transcript_38773:198-437(+)
MGKIKVDIFKECYPLNASEQTTSIRTIKRLIEVSEPKDLTPDTPQPHFNIELNIQFECLDPLLTSQGQIEDPMETLMKR